MVIGPFETTRRISQSPRCGMVVRPAVTLTQADRHELSKLVRLCDTDGEMRSLFLQHVLRHKMQSAAIVPGDVPNDVAAAGSHVVYSLGAGVSKTGLLSHRARAGGRYGIIPVSSLLGATLLGMRAGTSAPLLRDDGSIVTLLLLDVRHPDDAASPDTRNLLFQA
ncbi:hypothetical protein [Rhodovulum]|uniref:Regulator of nucleoside diphosphate kinase n=2 Tax=Rhodovulum TaxID=34008 RepID=A0A4R2PS71_9RHOB|nr:hypothetical protein [Rhodovulum]TCP38617.1 hypothetical protein EV662_12022 [Rhodovulum marinum]TDX24718.1 hypothetical protein EV657_12238 [Rhodovulum visakhapatnamense]